MITNYKSLPLGKYLQILSICQAPMEEYDRNTEILSLLTDMDTDTLLNLPIGEFAGMMKKAQFITIPLPEVKGHRVASLYKVGDFSLTPCKDVRKMTAAQYIDWQTFAKMGEAHLPHLLSCLLIPVGKKYNEDYDIIAVQSAIKESLSIIDAMELCAFFLRRCNTLIASMLTYSLWQMMTIRRKTMKMKRAIVRLRQTRDLYRDGDGFIKLISFPKLPI